MSYMTNFAKGLRVFGVPVTPGSADEMVYGSVYWVDNSNALSSDTTSNGTKSRPFATIDYAIGQCTASAGDVIYVGPFHSETITSSITMDVIGVKIRGIRYGNQMPTVIPNAVMNAVTMTAAGSSIANVLLSIPGTDAQTSDINIAAANCSVYSTRHLGSTAGNLNKVDIIVIQSTATGLLLDGVEIYNTTTEVPSGIKIAGAAARVTIRNCKVLDEIGFTNGAIYDAAIATHLMVENNVFQNMKANTVVMNFVANSTGIARFNHVCGRHTTLASNVVTGTGMNFFENRAVEEAAVNGAVIPAADTD
jgi:hypothetical protein